MAATVGIPIVWAMDGTLQIPILMPIVWLQMPAAKGYWKLRVQDLNLGSC